MNKIQKAIICLECNKILETPVLLPCRHSICQKHVIEKNELKCSKCGVDHEIPPNGFLVNEALCDIIESQISSIDFGSVHKEATESCAKLSRYIQDMKNLLNNPGAYSYDQIAQLKNQVNLKSKQLKLKIDEETQKLLDKLDDYQSRSENSLMADSCLISKRKTIYESNEDLYSSSLSFWMDELNELKFDEGKWRQITKTCNKSIYELDQEIKNFKKYLLLGEFKKVSKHVDFFEQISIDDLFIYDESNVSSNDKTGFFSFGTESSFQTEPNDFMPVPYDPNCYSTPKTQRVLSRDSNQTNSIFIIKYQ